jgi:pseudouridine-5'-phosphate glycosidase
VPEEAALAEDVGLEAIERANREADAAGIGGPALTPWILSRIAELTGGGSTRANTALIVNNVRAAADIAARLPAD